MIGWLLNALDGLPGWGRRAMVIVFPLLLFGVLVAAFALAPSGGRLPARRSTAADHFLPPAATRAPAPPVPVTASSPSYTTPPARTSGLDVDPDRPLPTTSPLRGMLASARSFADAYVLYEIGRLPPRVRRAIIETCTPGFARYLLAQPAHLAGVYAAHPRDAEVDRVVSVSFVGGVSVEVSFVAEQNSADTGAYLVKLARVRGRWLVTGVGL